MRNMLSGGISGIVSKTIGAPVDRVKLILQTQAVNVDVKTRYTGLTDCFTRVYKEQGVCAWCICMVCMHGVYACTCMRVHVCSSVGVRCGRQLMFFALVSHLRLSSPCL